MGDNRDEEDRVTVPESAPINLNNNHWIKLFKKHFFSFSINTGQRLITTHWAMNLKTSLRVKVPESSMIISCLIPVVFGMHAFTLTAVTVQ